MKLAVITARGGSKRIPRKNIRLFCGKPMIAYPIEAALNANFFDEVMVSTEDDEIANVARQYGATVPFRRSAKTADDFTATIDVILEVISQYHRIEIFPDYLCCLYPTAPFVTAGNLISAFQLLVQNEHLDVVLPIVRFSFPIQRALCLSNERVSFINPAYALTRSQDLEPAYHDAGQFYWCRVNALMENKSLIPEKTAGIVVPASQVQDIDNEEDWKLAEMKYKYRQL